MPRPEWGGPTYLADIQIEPGRNYLEGMKLAAIPLYFMLTKKGMICGPTTPPHG